MILPELVTECPLCNGKGERDQMYNAGCGGGMFSMLGPCDFCNKTGYVYKNTNRPITASVEAQIKELNAPFVERL